MTGLWPVLGNWNLGIETFIHTISLHQDSLNKQWDLWSTVAFLLGVYSFSDWNQLCRHYVHRLRWASLAGNTLHMLSQLTGGTSFVLWNCWERTWKLAPMSFRLHPCGFSLYCYCLVSFLLKKKIKSMTLRTSESCVSF